MAEHILNQLIGVGLLSERVYQQVPEDSEGDHVTASQAKIDPSASQTLAGQADITAPADEASDEVDTGDDEPQPEVEDAEGEPKPDASAIIDGARGLAALHAALHATQVLADIVYGAKDELVAKLGDEAAPALHEVLFKVKTAHETLAKLMDDVDAKDAAAEAEPKDDEDQPTDDTVENETEMPSDVVPPTEPKPGEEA